MLQGARKRTSSKSGSPATAISKKCRASSNFTFSEVRNSEDHTLYASHTVWQSRAVFEAWTKSEAFRAAHQRAGDTKPLYLGPPQFEGFEVRQTVGMTAADKVRAAVDC